MTISAAWAMTLTVTETLSGPFVSATAKDKDLVVNGLNKSGTINAGSTPPATLHAAYTLALTGGAGQLDLRALLGSQGIAVDGNGLKVQACILVNPSSNANTITITNGSTNGYTLFGASGQVTLSPGDRLMIYRPDTAPDVAAGAKLLDLAGTGAQVLDYQFVLG
jgi:hypothetical protein